MSHLVLQEPDRIDTPRAVLVGIIAIIVFALGILAAWLLLRARVARLHPHGPPPIPPAIGQLKIGMVHQNLFGVPAGPDLLQQQRTQLTTYGWIDRPRGVAHIPIERAMELVVQRARGGAEQQRVRGGK